MKTTVQQVFGMLLLTFVLFLNSAKAQNTVVNIIVNSPDHSTLETAVIAAKLDDDLSGPGPFTVFAPTNAAFDALPAGTLDALLSDPTGALAQILLYHVASGKVMSNQLSDEQIITTLQGKTVKVDITAEGVFINNAKVTVADLVADNGVVHVIDAVLLPPAKAAFPIDFETATDAVWSVFENGTGAPDDFMTIPNPDKTGINTSGNVLKFKVNDNALVYAGAVSESYKPVEFTEKSHTVTMMVWKSVISPVGFKVEGPINGGPADKEVKVSNTLINQWEKITFDFSSIIGFSYNKIVFFPDFPATRTSGTTAYIDNIEKKVSNTVVDIIVNSPDHSTLETAVKAAKLDDDLSGPGPFTVFAPTDAAFNALPAGTLDALLSDPEGQLKQILLYHVAGGNVMSTDLSDNQIITTLQGKKVKVNIVGGEVFINNAKVTVADIKADNGVVHVIDAVLLPSADVVVKETETMGKIITDTYGNSLYFFTKDAFGTSMCIDGCLSNWPVFYVENMEIGAGLNSDDFATIDRGSGVMQTTYKGWPLYYFINDSRPGVMLGDGVIGKWFIAKPDYTLMISDNQLTGLNGTKYKGDYTPGDEVIQYFTDGKGLTLYTWKNDKYNANKFTKSDFSNNGVWPIYKQDKIVVPSALNKADFDVINVFGVDQLTFKGWPLYYFGQDMMVRGNNKGVSVPSPGVWPVAVKNMMEAPNTVVDIIVNSPDHTILETAVFAAKLDDDLSGTGPFTVFAPTDAAFNVLPAGALDALLLDPTGVLAQILLYHVAGGKVMSTDLADEQIITTLLGETVKVDITEEGVFINNAKVTVADLVAGNGVVHVINAVLLPPVTVVDIIVNSPVHTILETAVIAAKLDDDLSGTGPFTVFAPTDDAFNALPAGTLDALLLDPTGELAQILLYHVSNGKVMSTDLSDEQIITTLQGKTVKVDITSEGVFINNAKVTVTDLVADNGVVHVINAVLLPPYTVVDVIVNSPDHTILETAVIAAKLDDDLSGTGPFTVFAPTDDAFNALPAGTLDALLLDPTGELAQILLYHVASGKVMSAELSDEQIITTLQGKTVKVDITSEGVFINNAKVTVVDLVADNGVVHVIDAVLLPPAEKAAFPIDFEAKTDAVWTVFSNGAGAPDDFMVIPNPDKTGINTSNNVLKFKVNNGADPWAGAFSDSYAPFAITQNSHIITMMVWKSIISPVAFKVEASTNGGPVTELKVPNTLTNQWEKITFDLSSLIGFSYNRIVIFPDFPAARTSGTTVYIDNIEKMDFTAVPGANAKGKIKVYPNPAVDVLNVTLPATKAEVSIYNSLGLLVESAVFTGKEARINVSRYAPGLYFVRVNGGPAVKFVK